jgi:hypothetical protein
MWEIVHPAPVPLIHPTTKKPILDGDGSAKVWRFVEDYFYGTLAGDKRFSGNLADLNLFNDIADKLENPKKIGNSLRSYLSDTERERFLEVVKEPSNGYNPIIMRQARAFPKAVTEAREVKAEELDTLLAETAGSAA